MVSTRVLIISVLSILACCTSCNEDGHQAGRAASQDPRFEEVKKLAGDSQVFYFTEFTGNQPKNTDSIKYSLREIGEGQYVQYELYNEYQNTAGNLELDVLESFIDTGDTIQKQKIRDQKFLLEGDSISLTRFDTKSIALQEFYEFPFEDSTYRVYNIFGYAHQGDYTPSHRIFWTQEFGSFLIWYGDWNTVELTHSKEPINAAALLHLRSEVRKLLAIPFEPEAGPYAQSRPVKGI